jgi:hypothetical protein
MLKLDQLQRRMGSAISGRQEPELLALIESDGIEPEARLQIYRNHATLTLTEALKASFPVVCRLVDERFFAYAAHEYIGETFPSQPWLAEYGESFPDFLASFPACRDLVYLADVARLEWAINLALHADEAKPLDRSALTSADIVLALHPSLQLVVSRWPIERIWRANQTDGDPETPINLDAGGVRLLVYRHGDRVIVSGIDESTFAFLDAIARGEPLAKAVQTAIFVAPVFDPTATLRLLFEEGLIAHPRCSERPRALHWDAALRPIVRSDRADKGHHRRGKTAGRT